MHNLPFHNSYLTFSFQAEPYQRADDVGYAISEFMWFRGQPFYPIGALAEAKIAHLRLSAGKFDAGDEDNLDLVFRMREAGGGHYFEIVLRSDRGTRYGGWAWGRELEVLDEFVNGYRVLVASSGICRRRFEFCCNKSRYRCVAPGALSKSNSTFAISPLTDSGLLEAEVSSV